MDKYVLPDDWHSYGFDRAGYFNQLQRRYKIALANISLDFERLPFSKESLKRNQNTARVLDYHLDVVGQELAKSINVVDFEVL